MTFKNRFTPILAALFASLTLLFFVRLFLWLRYNDLFSDLSYYETLASFVLGTRVDLISVLTFNALLILVATLPLKLIYNTNIRSLFGLVWGIVAALIFAVSFGDVLYFEYTLRHLSNELFNLSNDTNIIIDMALHSYLMYTLISTVFIFFIIFFFVWLFRQKIQNQEHNAKSWISVLLVIIALFFGIRNKFTGKSFGPSDAFAVNKVSSGNLALNGFFSVYRTAKNTGYKNNPFSFDKALNITKKMLDSNNTLFISEHVPLERVFVNPKEKKYNIVFVLIESWGAEHLDSYTPYEPLGVTPYFSYLSNHGMRFDNFYANGGRSIYGITTILSGVAKPTGFPPLGNGLEFSNLTYLASILKENGYDTLSIQGSSRRSYRMDSVMNLAGFDQYYGKSDIPNVETIDEGYSDGGIGTFDYNTLDYLHQKINTLKPPFFGFVFTASTHTASNIPQKKYEKLATKYLKKYDKKEWLKYLIIASIIQKESANRAEMPIVASVIYNRLSIDMPLQMDGTLNYGKYSHIKVTPKRIRTDKSKFNTYKNRGLPPYPICSVSIDAIESALKPATTKYLYFMKNRDGVHDFTDSYKSHLNNINRAKQDR